MYDDIVKYIPYGRENAISRDDLAIKVGCSDRIMRDLISKARKKTVIINIQNGSGYYRPTENVTKDGRTLLIEQNSAYSLGCYGLYSNYYAKMISAYISQISGTIDECDFRIYR